MSVSYLEKRLRRENTVFKVVFSDEMCEAMYCVRQTASLYSRKPATIVAVFFADTIPRHMLSDILAWMDVFGRDSIQFHGPKSAQQAREAWSSGNVLMRMYDKNLAYLAVRKNTPFNQRNIAFAEAYLRKESPDPNIRTLLWLEGILKKPPAKKDVSLGIVVLYCQNCVYRYKGRIILGLSRELRRCNNRKFLPPNVRGLVA